MEAEKITKIALILSTFIFTFARCSNILTVLPIASKSHHYMFQPILRELATRGHNVTVYSPYPLYNSPNERPSNVKEVEIHTSGESFVDSVTFEKLKEIAPKMSDPKLTFWFYGLFVCEDLLENPIVQKLIHSETEKFDLVLLESSFGQESLVAFGHKFDAPVISLSSFTNFVYLDKFTGSPFAISYIPHVESSLSSEMTFTDRLMNTFRLVTILINGHFSYLPQQDTLIRKYFNYTNSSNIPPIDEMLQNISLSIVNFHIGIDYARPLAPNVIPAAGLHISKKRKPLPKDLQNFMDNSKDGVIYFSFGTIIPVHTMPPETLNSFIKVFARLKQNILWKSNLNRTDLPSNIKIVKWVPQHDILGHPNCVAFMTHGGLMSQQEAVYFGVPMIAFPVFTDQFYNAIRAQTFGFGIKIEVDNITETSLYWALKEVVDNPIYRETARKRSKIFQDNPVSPLDNAVFWIEYVIRHQGAPHLQTQVVYQSLVQYLLIDVILFSLAVIALIIVSVYSLCKFLLKTILVNSRIEPQTKNKME